MPPTKLEQWKSSNWRPFAAFAGALLVGGILIPLTIQSGNAPAATQAVSSWQLSLPQSSTLVTQLAAAPGAPLRGQISPVADITGKAPVGGAVARWSVQPGTSVRAGQDVVQISSGAASAAPLPARKPANSGRRAANRGRRRPDGFVQTVGDDAAKTGGGARSRPKRRRKISAKRARSSPSCARAMRPHYPRPRRAANDGFERQIADARAATKDAQASFENTKTQLDGARSDLSAAQKSLAPLQSRLDDAQKNVATVEAKFDGSQASASDVQAARSARDNAKSTLKSATSRLENAQKQIPTLENTVGRARKRRRRRAPRRTRPHRRRARRCGRR